MTPIAKTKKKKSKGETDTYPKFVIILIILSIISTSAYDFGEKVPECEGPFDKDTPSPIFPDPSDCTKFFECESGGYLIQKPCAVGTKFDPEYKICVHKAKGSC
uniref:CSON012929 protein n=1 Tax=Culicoides sonorensis TaxID=179676 RepID=A0A336MAM2_CULSO